MLFLRRHPRVSNRNKHTTAWFFLVKCLFLFKKYLIIFYSVVLVSLVKSSATAGVIEFTFNQCVPVFELCAGAGRNCEKICSEKYVLTRRNFTMKILL